MAKSIDESAPEHRVGKVLADKWRVERLIGVGGVSSVFAAIDVASGDRVAMKVMHPELLEDTAVRARFLRAARLAGSIDHASVVRVIADGATEDGAPFLAMEFLDGETVDARIRRKGGRLPMREALWVADAALDALAAAHAMGVVHRDVRVENLFLTSDHVVKVLDFGVARVRRAAERKATASIASSRPHDAAADSDSDADGVTDDLWAVGAAMFTMMTGEPLLEGQLRDELVRAKTKIEILSLAAVVPEIPEAVTELVDRALNLDAAVGWSDARAMQRSVHGAIEVVKTRASHNPRVSSPFSAPTRAASPREISARAPAEPIMANMKIPRAPSVPDDARRLGFDGASASSERGTISLTTAVAVIGAAICIGGALAWILGR
jgi:serine/threonine-protein kinase